MRGRGCEMDKIAIQFFADVLYLKGLLCYEELEAILDAQSPEDLDMVFEKMFRGQFNPYKRGEPYTDFTVRGD